jgi:hypothetical protein
VTLLITSLYADMVWPALVLEKRILSVGPITAGLLIEWFALWRCGFGLSWKKAAVVDITMNAVSAAIGVVLIPALGFGWEYFAEFVIGRFLNLGSFNPISWVVTFLIAVFATTLIEAAVVRWGFNILLGQQRFWTLFAANFISVALAFISLIGHPPNL